MKKTLIGALVAAGTAIGSASGAILTGEGQLMSADGDVVGTLTARLDTEATFDFDCEVDQSQLRPPCAGPTGTVQGQLTLTFNEEEPSEARLFIDPALGPSTIVATGQSGSDGEDLFAITSDFVFGLDGFATEDIIILGDFLDVRTISGDVLTGGSFFYSSFFFEEGGFTLTIDGLDDYLNPVPLPAGAVLFLTGAAGLLARRRLVG